MKTEKQQGKGSFIFKMSSYEMALAVPGGFNSSPDYLQSLDTPQSCEGLTDYAMTCGLFPETGQLYGGLLQQVFFCLMFY